MPITPFALNKNDIPLYGLVCALLRQEANQENLKLAEAFEKTCSNSHQIKRLLSALRAHGALGKACGWIEQHHPVVLGGLPQVFGLSHSLKQKAEKTWEQGQTLIGLLEKAGIQAKALKGPWLSEILYGFRHWRLSDDIDLFIPAPQLGQAVEALLHCGYKMAWYPRQSQLDILIKNECELSFYHPMQPVPLEIHWRALPRAYPGFLGCIEKGDHNLEESKVSEEWQWLYLLAHGGLKHGFDRLAHIYEPYTLSRKNTFNISWARQLAQIHGLGALVNRAEQLHIFAESLFDSTHFSARNKNHVPGDLDKKSCHMALQAWFSDDVPEQGVLPEGNDRQKSSDRGDIPSVQKKIIPTWRFLSEMLGWPVGIRYLFYRAVLPSYYDVRFFNLPKCLSFMYIWVKAIRKLVWSFDKSKAFRDVT